ncbi:hypothetical protein [Polaromonas sp.]|uniref:hypothetical protein n=1 Tax=Polaromonas sp. TaxID=1869339 RepID=UPI003263D681
MATTTLEGEVAAFFDAFVEAFHTFDGQAIALRYLAPYSALHAGGTVECFSAQPEIAGYFQKVVDSYRSQGCRSCRYNALEVVSMGQACVLGTVTWELLLEDGRVLQSWRESYTLARTESGLRVFATVDHVD